MAPRKPRAETEEETDARGPVQTADEAVEEVREAAAAVLNSLSQMQSLNASVHSVGGAPRLRKALDDLSIALNER